MTSWLPAAGLAALSFFLGVFLTGRARAYALRRDLLDVANQRGSHSAPTPRGGGIAIVAAVMIAAGLAWASGLAEPRAAAALILGGLPVAAIGWLDDHGHVRASARIVAHAVGAGIVIWLLGSLPLEAILPFWSLEWTLPAAAVTLFFIVWMINLYNFMDGIDGIAGGEAATVALGGAALFWLGGEGGLTAAIPALILAAAAIGFLFWNWPPAKIFMGDVSSGFLGLSLAALTLAAGLASPLFAWAWIALLGVFIADATMTLLHRLIRGEKVYEAHRSHAYQRLSRRMGAHLPVTALTIGLTVGFCFPVACCIVLELFHPFVGVAIVLVPLGAGAIFLGAGSATD